MGPTAKTAYGSEHICQRLQYEAVYGCVPDTLSYHVQEQLAGKAKQPARLQ
jgi:hypothetical protein